jgi:hypothetical protein
MPGAGRTRSLACTLEKAHERSHRGFGRIHPAFPHANGFNGLLRALPGDRAFCHRHLADCFPRNLASASRCQNHTTSPSVPATLVSAKPKRPPHPARNVCDDRDSPSGGAGRRTIYYCFGGDEKHYFGFSEINLLARMATSWSGFDIRYPPRKVPAAMGSEC